MNYLAHAYLSFNQEQILLGNMISDFVKGKQQYNYPQSVHKGIVLHRAIDAFADIHAATKEAKTVFKKAYRLYSGAFIDVVNDHFLALDTATFTKDSLFEFSQTTYHLLEKQEAVMPEAFRRMFFYMRSQNWLYSYRTREGIYQSFGGLVKRAAYLHDSSQAVEIFELHYDFLKECFDALWQDMKPFARYTFETLLQQ